MANGQPSIIDFPLPDFSRWDFSDGGSNDDGFDDDRWSDYGSSDDGSDDGGPNDDRANVDTSNNDGSNDDDQLARERLDLDGELSVFLRSLLVIFHNVINSNHQDFKSPIPELVVALLNAQGRVPPNFQSALRLFITTTWRSSPSVFDTGPSVAQLLVTSVDDFIMRTSPDTPNYSKEIAIRLHAITYGPRAPSESIANLYHGPVSEIPFRLLTFYFL